VNQPKETWTSRLIRRLSHRSAIVRFEAYMVTNLQQTLGPSALEEMACHSTNPVVSSIALQAIAGIHHEDSPFQGGNLPTALRTQLRAAVTSCLQESYPLPDLGRGSPQLAELTRSNRLLGTPTTVERLGRAMLCLPDFSTLDGNKIRSIVACK
jgi:hypothetical protein